VKVSSALDFLCFLFQHPFRRCIKSVAVCYFTAACVSVFVAALPVITDRSIYLLVIHIATGTSVCEAASVQCAAIVFASVGAINVIAQKCVGITAKFHIFRTLIQGALSFQYCARVEIFLCTSRILASQERAVWSESISEGRFPFTTPPNSVATEISVIIMTLPVLTVDEVIIPFRYESTWASKSMAFGQAATTFVLVCSAAIHIVAHDVSSITPESHVGRAREYRAMSFLVATSFSVFMCACGIQTLDLFCLFFSNPGRWAFILVAGCNGYTTQIPVSIVALEIRALDAVTVRPVHETARATVS
jgi:hypothetical protein